MKIINTSKWIILFSIITILFFTACSDDSNPVDTHESDHDHAEAAGLIVSLGDQELVSYKEGTVTGSFAITTGQTTDKLTIQFIAEDGDIFTPEGDHYAFVWEVGNTAVANILQEDSYGKWEFAISAIAAGQTTVIFKIFHEDHADFVSPEISITVAD